MAGARELKWVRAVHIHYKTELFNLPIFLLWFLLCFISLVWVLGVFADFFFSFPYSYTMDIMYIGDGQINCGSRWTGKGMETEPFATLDTTGQTMQNLGFLKSLWLHSCCQAQEYPRREVIAISASQCLTAATQPLKISLNTTLAIQYT